MGDKGLALSFARFFRKQCEGAVAVAAEKGSEEAVDDSLRSLVAFDVERRVVLLKLFRFSFLILLLRRALGVSPVFGAVGSLAFLTAKDKRERERKRYGKA